MKATVAGIVLAGIATILLGERQHVSADPVPRGQVVPPPVLVRAPAGKEKAPEDALAKKVRDAREKAIKYLKARQNKDGGFEDNTLNLLQPGGTSCLAMLALLESGLKLDDEDMKRGMKYIREIKPQHTYVVGLQTQVLCKANQKEDADLVKRNVKWLEESAVWRGKNLEGWSYQANAGNRADNSNTRYALAGLYAANRAGIKVSKEKFWDDVRDMYVRGQTGGGGWTYQNGAGNATQTMTFSGILGLVRAQDAIDKTDKNADRAIEAGFAWIAKEFTISNRVHTFYNLDVMAAVGRASNRKDFGTNDKKREWYKEGAEWLLENQKPGGEWQLPSAIDNFPVISTSFALRFLASRPE
jgi:hypothetical protein